MAVQADASTLDRQPKQRRTVYECLAKEPDGSSVKNLLEECGLREVELRETLRKLEAAGLARRIRGVWTAVPIEPR